MTPIDWAKRPFQKYADFSGRAPRAEFWWYILAIVVAAAVISIIESMLGLSRVFGPYGPITLILLVATFIPSLAVQTRRLHDTNRSGWWLVAFYLLYCVLLWSIWPMLGAMSSMDGAVTDPAAMPAMPTGIAMFASLAIFVMAIVLIVFWCFEGTKGDNKYGPDPYAGQH